MNKINVFLTNDIILFPNSEVRFETDNFDDKEIFSLLEENGSVTQASYLTYDEIKNVIGKMTIH